MRLNSNAHNKYGCVGVTYDKSRNKYRVEIWANAKRHYVGIFKDLEDAIKARRKAEIKYANSI